MPWNEINFTIKPNVDFGNAKEQLADVRNGIEGLKHSFEDMPNFTRIMDNSLEKTVTIADNLGNKFEQLSDPSIKDDARSRIETDIQNGIAELNAHRDLRLGQSNYSVELAKSYFGGLPQAVRQELDAITPQVASIIRSKMSTLSNKGSITTGASIGQIAKSLDREARKKDTELNKLLVSSGLSSEGLYQFEDYVKFLIPQVASSNRLKEYQVARYNETLSKTKNYFNRGDPTNLFPESFRKSYQSENGRYVQTDLTEKELNMVLSANERKRFDEMFASNPIAVKAALASGISRRDDRGLLETKEEISRRDLENFRSAMYDQLINRVAGYATSFVDPYEHIKKLDRETVASRLTQSTSGKTMLALQELEELQNPDLWVSSTGNKYYRKNYKEAERQLDEYATLKYSPFLPNADLANYEYSKDNAKTVGISESQATRVLGNGKWINNQDISDTVRLISLAGYDKSKKDHREALYDLYQNGVVIDGEEFVAESTHGKGEDAVIRMLSRKARDEANARQALWAKEAGFTGTYFGNFSEDSIAKNIENNKMSSVKWGKYFEGQNKKWTPSADLGVNPQNIKIAVVDTTGTLGDNSDFEFGDGAMWLSNMLMRDSAQARIGAAGKGSGFVFQGKDIRSLYEKWGLLDENGNAIAKGYNGDNIDISDANVILPKSMLKNKLAYEGKTSEEISKMVTAEAKNLGIGEVVNYNKENTYSDNLGTQAMSFLNFSPAVRMHQIELAKKRLQELDTETGQLQYVFGGDDWFSTQIRNNTRLLGTEQAQKWVDNYKTRLMQNLAAGRFFDFGEGDQKFSNVRAAANPLTTMLMSQYGGITPAVLQKAREYIAKDAAERGVEAPTYTDKELEDLIILKHGNAIDFQHEDQDQLTMLRSPMGYGNILNVRNRAKEARALYEGFGIIGKGERGPGAYASEEDRQVLQGFDYDADQFKIVLDPVLVKEIQAISKLQPFVDRKKEIEEQEIQIDNINDPAFVRTEIAGFKKDMQLGMGTHSGGTRAMQLDLTDPTNREYIVGAQQMQALYDIFTTKDKNPKDAKIPQQVWDTVKLGKEFTKFTDHAHELFRFDDDQLDAEGNVDVSNKDVFRSEKTGQFINLRALRQMGVDEINAPSINMASHVMGVGLSNLAYQLGMSDTTRWDAIAEAMDALDYGNAGPQRQALMKTMRHMLPEWGSGKRGKLSPNEEKILDQLITNAREELIEEAEGSYNSETKKYVAKDGTEYASVNSYVENQRSKYGIRSAENLLNMFGFTEKRGKAKLGDTFDTFTNLSAFDYIQDIDEEDKKRRERLVKEITNLQNATTESADTDKTEQQSKKAKSKTRKAKTKSVKNDEPRFGPGAQDRSAESRSYNMGNVDQESFGQQTTDKTNEIVNEPKTKTEKDITDLQKELALLDEKSGRRIDFRTKMNQILSDARDVSQELWISGKGNENKINDNISLAHSYWNRQFYGTTKPQIELLDELLAEANKSEDFNDSEKSSIRTQVNNVKNDLYRNLNQDFVNKAIAYSKSVAEDIEKEIQKTENEPSSQKKRLNQIDESIKESEGFVAEIQKRMRAKDIPYNQESQDLFGYGLQNVKERITQQQSNRAQLAALYTKENEQNATIAMEALQGKLGYRDKNSLEVQLQNRRQLIQERRDDITKKHSENLMSDSFYQNQIALLDQYDSTAMADIVKENRLALGLDKQTPQEKAADWAKKRIELIDASNKIAMDEAHNKWLNGTGSYEDYVLAQKKYYNADEDKEKRKILEESKQMANFDAEYQNIRLSNLESANSIQGENLLHRQQLDRDRFRNQLQRRYSRSRIAAGFYSLDDRALSKQEEIRGYEQTNKRLSGRQAELDKLLTQVNLPDDKRREYESEKKRNADTIDTNVQAIANAKQEVEELSSVGARAGVVFQSLSQSIGLVAQRLGRQLFQKALQETKRFVKEFDASMNEIQAITLKSDSEMASVRSGTINRAIGLRTSVSNVANTEAALYRQGLSDQEVATRTESIIKFATVTKLNVQEATKIITTALQNDLVGSATEAMDALVALGDSAATTAAEIGKGMQKAAASAKVAGVSYSELTALLTIGTSDTQLSGTQVGTALQTVFSRMRRLSVSGWTSDQNGEKTTASDAEAALKTVGVDLWDDKALGKMRSAYDVLSDLSKVWQNLSDAQKNIVMNAMAGTRQTNVFSTLMEGMSEDGGATLDKYLGLAEGSEGVTQSKYEIAMQSLAASMDTLKSSWDSVVESMINGGSVTSVLDTVSSFLQSISNNNGIEHGFSVIIGGIAGIGTAIALIASGNPVLKAFSTALSLIVGLATAGGLEGIFTSFKTETPEEKLARESAEDLRVKNGMRDFRENRISNGKKALEEVKKFGEEYDKLQSKENEDALVVSLEKLATTFPEVSAAVQAAIQDLSNWKNAVKEAENVSKGYVESNKKNTVASAIQHLRTYSQQEFENSISSLVSPEDKEAAKTSLRNFMRIYSDGVGPEKNFIFENMLTSDGSLSKEKITSASKYQQAQLLKLAFKGSKDFRKVATSYLGTVNPEVLAALQNNTASITDRLFQEQAAAVMPDLLDELLGRSLGEDVATAWRYQINKGTATGDVVELLNDDNTINYDYFNKLSSPSQANAFYEAYQGSPVLQKWVSRYDRENGTNFSSDLWNQESYQNADKNAISEIAKKAFDETKINSYASSVRQASYAFAKGMADQLPLDLVANDEYNTEFVQTALWDQLRQQIETNPDEYLDDNNKLKTEAVTAFFDDWLNSWLSSPSEFYKKLQETAPDEAFSYFIGEGKNRQRFTSYDAVLEYARNNNVAYTDILDKNGNSAYQTVDNIISAKNQEANAKNRQYLVGDFLHGVSDIPGYRYLSEDEQNRIARERLRKQGIREPFIGNILGPMRNRLLAGTEIAGAETFSDFKSLKDAYTKKGRDSDFANILSGNAGALAAYLANDYDLFLKALGEEEAGTSTPMSQAEYMRAINESLMNNKGFVGRFRTDSDLEDLRKTYSSFFGEQADAILNAIEEGTFVEGTDIYDYAEKTLAEKGLKLGTGKRFTGIETADFAKRVLGIGDWTKAQATLGWSTDEWSALTSKYPDLQRYLEMNEKQRQSTEGQNLRRNLEIQFSVAGISDLEEAGKLLEGTANIIESLKKDGKFEIEAIVKMRQETHQQSQLDAMLESGTDKQKREAVMQITGASETEYYARQADLTAEAKKIRKEERENVIRSRNLERAEVEDKEAFDAEMLAAGYQWTEKSTYKLPNGYSIDNEGNVLLPNGKIDEKQTRIRRKLISGGTYKYIGGQAVDAVNSLLTESPSFTETESLKALNEILNGNLEYSNETADRYLAGYNAAGTYTKELIKRRVRGEDVEPWLQTASDNELINQRNSIATGHTSTLRQAQQAQYALDNYSGERAGLIATYLNMSEEDVKKMWNNGEGKQSIQDEIKRKNEALLSEIGEQFDFDFDPTDLESTRENISNAIANSGSEIERMMLEMLRGMLTDAEGYLSGDNGTSISDVFESASDTFTKSKDERDAYNWLRTKTGETLVSGRIISGIAGETSLSNGQLIEQASGNNEALQSILANNNLLVAGINNWDAIGGQEGFNRLLDYSQYGEATPELTSVLTKALFGNTGFVDSTGMFTIPPSSNAEDLRKQFEVIRSSAEGMPELMDLLFEQVPELKKFFETGSDEHLSKALEAANAQMSEAKIRQIAKYSKGIEGLEDIMIGLSKGGTAATEAELKLNAGMRKLSNQTTALNKAAGKTGKQVKGMTGEDAQTMGLLSEMFHMDAGEIEKMSAQEMDDMINKVRPVLTEQFSETVSALGQMIPPQALDLPLGDLITINAEGQIDLTDVGQTLDGVSQQILAMIASLARYYGGIDLKAILNDKRVDVKGFLSSLGAAGVKTGGGYSGRGSRGGGGGGKSATDKLLENQKQRISGIEHQSKMLEIQEKYLDFTNDYNGYSSNIDQQIANQERLRSAYAQSIQELKNQLATLKRGSDDWNKANDQLMQYEENLENIKNTINDLGAKRITIVEQKQENEDRRGSHNLNMLSKMAARYQKSGQFESYEGIMEQTIEETRKQIHLNDKQITEWENLLKTFEENSDSWIQTRDKIWAMREENAELQNQMASDLIDLQEARVAQIAEDLQNQKAPLEHRANMLDTYGQMYESVNDFTKYRGTLEGTIDTNRQMKEMTDAAIAQVKKQIDGMAESDPARQSAIQTLYELEEASAQYEASILSNQQAIEESLISELTQAHQDSGSILEHELKLLSEAEKEFIRNDDFVNYENILEEKARNASDRLKDQQNALEDYLALQNSGKITEGGQQWRELEDTIRSTKENIASLKNEWQEALEAIEKAKFTNLKETFAETYDLSQHQQKLVQYDQTKYQNNGQLTNYGTALEWEGKILEDQRDNIQNHIKDLEEQLNESKEFPELYKEITKEIMTWEEKLADTNNRIEKNTELIEKNQDAIRKARIAVENEADKAIRAWIQKQRNMLSATVTMQNNIFAIISKNYQQQWALEQKTLDKKKQTLNEEKNLINERVNFRKKMMDQEAKDEELAEYRRQLTLISQDTTRTREANELRRKIQEMEKEQAMQNAQDVANAEIQSLNDQSKAIDDYAATYQENLTELLSNINNFKDIIDGLLSGSFEDFVNWNAEYNEDFKKSSDEQRQQLINGWEDTWYTMLGQLRTYWDQVDESMQSRDGFLELLKTQDEYLKLSDTGRESYLYRAGELYDSFTASMIDDATFSDNHEIIDTINDLKDWTFNVNIAGLGNYDFGGSISDYVYNRDRSVIPYEYDSDYKGVGYVAPPPAPAPAPSSGGGGSSSGSGKSSSGGSKKIWDVYDEKGNKTNWTVEAYTVEEANQIVLKKYGKYYGAATHMDFPSASKKTSTSSSSSVASVANATVKAAASFVDNLKNFFGFSEGGEVDYTGLAMVHGSPQKPEAFLNAEDRANMRAMLDAFTYVKAPTMTHIDPSMYGTTTNNYGDVNITINEAKIDNDQDISALAQKIGKEFTKELSKSGFNTASYAW